MAVNIYFDGAQLSDILELDPKIRLTKTVQARQQSFHKITEYTFHMTFLPDSDKAGSVKSVFFVEVPDEQAAVEFKLKWL